MKRLAHVVVGAELQAPDAILGAGVRGQKDDGRGRGALAQQARQLEAVAIGQTHVQQRQLECSCLGDRATRGQHGLGTHDLIACRAQALHERLGDVALVLDHEQAAHSCARPRSQLGAKALSRRAAKLHRAAHALHEPAHQVQPHAGTARARAAAEQPPEPPVPGGTPRPLSWYSSTSSVPALRRGQPHLDRIHARVTH